MIPARVLRLDSELVEPGSQVVLWTTERADLFL